MCCMHMLCFYTAQLNCKIEAIGWICVKMLLLSVLYIFLGVKSFECLYHSTIPKDTDILVNNFFANLEADVSSHSKSALCKYTNITYIFLQNNIHIYFFKIIYTYIPSK